MAFKLVKVDKRRTIQASIRLIVRFRTMMIPELALRLGFTSKLVRRCAAKAEDLHVFDGMVRWGNAPAF